MKQSIFIPILIIFSACVRQVDGLNEIQEINPLGISAIPDGFEYEMYEPTELSVSFTGSSSRISSDQQILYAIIGTDEAGEAYELMVDHASLESGINYNFKKPFHIVRLHLYIKYLGNAQFFDLESNDLALTLNDLIVSDEIIANHSGRTLSTPNCTSYLGNATQIKCRSDGISIKSSASILYIDAVMNDGSIITAAREDYAENANGNQWFFPSEVVHANAAKYLIYAECSSSPKEVSKELVTFSNPCYDASLDQDQDGVNDEVDAQPNESSISSQVYIPAKDKFSTYAFEDMWPYLGDFDFNDLVVSQNSTVYIDANDKVSKVDYQMSIRAIGAKFDNDLCISFSAPIDGIVLESISKEGIEYEMIDIGSKTELRFKHISSIYGNAGFVNTDSSANFIEPEIINFTLSLDRSIDFGEFEQDVYIRIDQNEGREAHRPGMEFTSLFDKKLMGTSHDDTNPGQGKYFLSDANLPWVLEIPIDWEYPRERVKITEAYPNFATFTQGKSNKAWYTDEVGNKVHKKIYHRK